MASGLIGPSGLTLELHVSPLRQPSPSRSISTKPTSMIIPGALQAKGCLRTKLGVGCTFASRLRVEGDEPVETVEEIGQIHWGRSEAAPIRTRFANGRHGVHAGQVRKPDRSPTVRGR